MVNNIAIIAGSGSLPFIIAKDLKEKKINFIVLFINNFCDTKKEKDFKFYNLNLGQGKKAVQILKDNNIENIIFLGGLRKPNIFTLRPDFWTLVRVLPFFLKKQTDDSLLRNVIKIFENQNFKVIGLKDISNDYFLKRGLYSKRNIPLKDKEIIFNILKKVVNWTRKDKGQSAISSMTDIISFEDSRGTDNLIDRIINNKKSSLNSYLFIKIKKLNQDVRIDLPTFGFTTLKKLVKTNIKYIILQSEYTVILDKKKILNYLKNNNIKIVSIDINNSNTISLI